MSLPAAPTITERDNLAVNLDHPGNSWLQMDILALVDAAKLQPNESVLDVFCATGALLLEIQEQLGNNHGRLVGIDQSRAMVQRAVANAERKNLSGHFIFFHGDFKDLGSVQDLQQASSSTAIPHFDVVFARDALPEGLHQQRSALNQYKQYLTPGTGRLVVSFLLGAEDFGEIAGSLIRVDELPFSSKLSYMLESEWREGGAKMTALAESLGLEVIHTHHGGFDGRGALEWQDMRAYMEERTAISFAEQEDPKPSHWVNSNGTFSTLYKRQFKWKHQEELKPGIIAAGAVGGLDPDRVHTMFWGAKLVMVLRVSQA